MSSSSYESHDRTLKAYRLIAYSAASFAIVAVLAVCVTLPLAYNYGAHVRRQMHADIAHCKVWSGLIFVVCVKGNRVSPIFVSKNAR